MKETKQNHRNNKAEKEKEAVDPHALLGTLNHALGETAEANLEEER